MFQIVEGDLFSFDADIYAHGANCMTTMRSGIAEIVAKEYPEAVLADKKTKYGDESKLGYYTYWSGNHYRIPNKQIIIINGYTQYRYGRDAVHARPSAINDLFFRIIKDFPDKHIAIPLIGCDRGGLSFNKDVLPLIKKHFDNTYTKLSIVILPGTKLN